MVKLYNNDNYREVVNNNILLDNQNVTELQRKEKMISMISITKISYMINILEYVLTESRM